MTTLPSLDRFFVGLELPATKESIMSHARALGADENVLTMLSMIPSTTYKTAGDVLEAVRRNMPVELAVDPATDEDGTGSVSEEELLAPEDEE